MDRFLLDIENLPKAKKEVIFQITSNYPDKKRVAFLKSLIFLGFSTIKQADIDVATANIGKSSNANSSKYRIILTNTPIADFLKSIKNKTTKRSCVYAFLYAGITSYIDFLTIINSGITDKKVLENIEKKLFLCGLGEHLISNLSINVQIETPTSPPQSVVSKNTLDITNNSTEPKNIETQINFDSNRSTTPRDVVGKTTTVDNVRKSPKPHFKIDGV